VAQHSGVKIVREVPGCNAKAMASLIDNPCKEPYWKLRGEGGAYEVFFLTTLDRTPGLVSLMEGVLAENGFPSGNMGLYIQPIQQGRVCHMEFHLYFDPSDKKAVDRADKTYQAASEKLAENKAFFSRPYGSWCDIAYARCPDTVEALRNLKGIFDPNGVLNRGKLCFEGV
jgi:FAD/FMN-containing dehydrogenase